MLFFPLINVKMPRIVGILTFMSRKNFMLSCVEHEKSFITSGPGLNWVHPGTVLRAVGAEYFCLDLIAFSYTFSFSVGDISRHIKFWSQNRTGLYCQ